MKQDILCTRCAKDRRKQFPDDNPYPGEHIKFVKGIAKKDMLCDGCATKTPIKKGEPCIAASIWADYGGVPYYEWEDKFINKQ